MELSLTLTLFDYALLIAVGFGAAVLNSMAGGGSFFMFPALVFVGLPPQLANVTNKVGMWTGAVSSAFGYREEIAQFGKQIWPIVSVGVVGSIIGSLLLLVTPAERFEAMVPFLMGAATLLFAFGNPVARWIKRRVGAAEGDAQTPHLKGALPFIGQGIIGLYAGFFGAGMGIMMMALYQLLGITHIHLMNGLKVSVASAMLSISAITFIVLTPIHWASASAVIIGAIVGGYYGPMLAKRLPMPLIRAFIIVYGVAATTYFAL